MGGKHWKAQITANYKMTNLGYFATEAEARAAYIVAKRIYHSDSPVPDDEE